MEKEVQSSSSQTAKSVAFVVPEDAYYSFCFTDRPRKGTWIEDDRYLTFTWVSKHEEVDSNLAKWETEDKLGPIEKALQQVELEAQQMLVEINHRKAVADEFRESMGTKDCHINTRIFLTQLDARQKRCRADSSGLVLHSSPR